MPEPVKRDLQPGALIERTAACAVGTRLRNSNNGLAVGHRVCAEGLQCSADVSPATARAMVRRNSLLLTVRQYTAAIDVPLSLLQRGRNVVSKIPQKDTPVARGKKSSRAIATAVQSIVL